MQPVEIYIVLAREDLWHIAFESFVGLCVVDCM
jgi:hypothetical protein